MTSDPKETSVTFQDVESDSKKHINNDKEDPSWAAEEKKLLIPACNLNLISGMRLTGRRRIFFPGSGGRTYPH